jgi:hypothetical protein
MSMQKSSCKKYGLNLYIIPILCLDYISYMITSLPKSNWPSLVVWNSVEPKLMTIHCTYLIWIHCLRIIYMHMFFICKLMELWKTFSTWNFFKKMATHTKDFCFQEMAQDRHKKGTIFWNCQIIIMKMWIDHATINDWNCHIKFSSMKLWYDYYWDSYCHWHIVYHMKDSKKFRQNFLVCLEGTLWSWIGYKKRGWEGNYAYL